MKNLYKGRHSLTVLELTALPDEPEAMDILSIAEPVKSNSLVSMLTLQVIYCVKMVALKGNENIHEGIQVDPDQKFLHQLHNPQYDRRLFIELQVQYMKIASSEHVVYIANCSECQKKNNLHMYTTCYDLAIFMY